MSKITCYEYKDYKIERHSEVVKRYRYQIIDFNGCTFYIRKAFATLGECKQYIDTLK